jgi:polyphosphate kinase 2 (PPK2 family)
MAIAHPWLNAGEKQPLKVVPPIRLRDFDSDFNDGLDKDETREKTTKLCQRIGELQELLYANARHSVLILLQGNGFWARTVRLTQYCRMWTRQALRRPISSRPPGGAGHDYLWRVHQRVPLQQHRCVQPLAL